MGAIRRSKTKRRTRDIDQVHADLRSEKRLAQLKASVPDEDKPGLGQFHCIECAKYFESEHSMLHHLKGKRHKRRVRLLKDIPYTDKEADAAAGVGTTAFLATRESLKQSEKLGEKEMELDVVE